MRPRDGFAPMILNGLTLLALLVALAWIAGLAPRLGTATVGAAPTRGGGAWIERLGLSQLEPWASPNPLFEERIAALGDGPAAAALKRDLCVGAGMDGDAAFREARRALVRNDGRLCAAPAERLASLSPVVVRLGPAAGWPAFWALVALLAGAALWRLATLKRAVDRWRLLDRSTFGASRRAGSG